MCIRDSGGLDRAFHHQGVAIGNLDALELDIGADGQFAAGAGIGIVGGHCAGVRRSG